MARPKNQFLRVQRHRSPSTELATARRDITSSTTEFANPELPNLSRSGVNGMKQRTGVAITRDRDGDVGIGTILEAAVRAGEFAAKITF